MFDNRRIPRVLSASRVGFPCEKFTSPCSNQVVAGNSKALMTFCCNVRTWWQLVRNICVEPQGIYEPVVCPPGYYCGPKSEHMAPVGSSL